MASFNNTVLVGNLTRDPELRKVGANKDMSVCDITLAVNNPRNKDEKPLFMDVTLWRKTAEIVDQYTKKGDCVLVRGRLKQESWESDGQNRSKIVLVADDVTLLGGSANGNGSAKSKSEPAKINTGDDDIPF